MLDVRRGDRERQAGAFQIADWGLLIDDPQREVPCTSLQSAVAEPRMGGLGVLGGCLFSDLRLTHCLTGAVEDNVV